ncbi:hypothetical protein [Alteribacter populi]|uniref:fluoroquinolone export ABC transporter permease subunit n=1 Tax=Alteribacter populi TaxID=2011011 RepID=UPI000BBA9879|nr:hypothetical protein [Alteribacter populi]
MIWKLFKQDVQFQFRHGFYYVYALVTFVYIIILFLIPPDVRGDWGVLVIFTDPGTLGFFFIGTIVMLERNQQLLTYLFATPVLLRNYLISKLLSLTLIAWATSVLITVFTLGIEVNYILLTVSVILCSFFFTAVGLVLSVDAKSINHFMFRSIITMTILYVPIISYLDLVSIRVFEILPSYSALFLINQAAHDSVTALPVLEFLLHIFILILWTVLVYLWAYSRFNTYIISNTGETRRVSI